MKIILDVTQNIKKMHTFLYGHNKVSKSFHFKDQTAEKTMKHLIAKLLMLKEKKHMSSNFEIGSKLSQTTRFVRSKDNQIKGPK